MFQIGPYRLDNQVVLAPMAGVTDLPFRQLCRRMGAGLVVSEMVTCDTRLWNSRKSRYRLSHSLERNDSLEHGNSHGQEIEPRSVQIAGSDPQMMAEAARMNVEIGAQIIDINMGCPAKKVCKKAAGSALMKDEKLVAEILQAVVGAVSVPVTLKTRTGWASDQKNAVSIAKIAQDSGIQALAVHGRTRACGYKGDAEYDTIAEVKSAITIPVIANGDINSPLKALQVLNYTGADAVMIGRAAQGKPWICREIDHFLRSGVIVAPLENTQVKNILLEHLIALHAFYGEFMGLKIARKHVSWYLQNATNDDDGTIETQVKDFRRHFNQLDQAPLQIEAINNYFENLTQGNSKSSSVSIDSNELILENSTDLILENSTDLTLENSTDLISENSNKAINTHNRDNMASQHQEVIAA